MGKTKITKTSTIKKCLCGLTFLLFALLSCKNNEYIPVCFSPIDKTDRYSLDCVFEDHVRTYEAFIEAKKTTDAKGGTIIGNYNDEYSPGISFRIYKFKNSTTNGFPQLNIRYDREKQEQYSIEENIYDTGVRHIVFTITDREIRGYLDGELKGVWSYDGTLPKTYYPYSVGGDCRNDNDWWYKGRIHSVYCFSNIRSEEDIKADYKKGNVVSVKNLLAGFDFDNCGYLNLGDKNNQLRPYLYDGFLRDRKDYDYTFAVVPDTQAVLYYHKDHFKDIYNLIVDNKEKMNIQLTIGLGDIVELNTHDEWDYVVDSIYSLGQNGIPFTLIRGNHDLIDLKIKSEERFQMFSYYFDNATYRQNLSGFFENRIDNAYRKFEIDGVKYLILLLDYGPSDEVLEWANTVVSSNPDYNVIVTTHAFLFRDGTFLDVSDEYPPSKKDGHNNGDDIWNKFARKHKNISLILCGHDPVADIVKTTLTGDNGNKVQSLLIDPQYVDSKCIGLGMVAFLHFSNKGKNVSLEYFSSIQNKHFKKSNQIEFKLDLI